MASANERKESFLEARGYQYWCERMVYFHRGDKKIFSLEYLMAHSFDEIRRDVEETLGSDEAWSLYFNCPASCRVAADLVEEIIRMGAGDE